MLTIIVNPTAGNGRAKQVGEQIEGVLAQKEIAHEVLYTEHAGHATELSRAAAMRGADTIAAVGGDGTVLETMRGLHGTQAALGIIPAGTGNDVIKMLGTPKQPLEALDFLLSHPARPLDVGRINDMLFLNVCGTGFDVKVLDYAESAKRYVRGMLPYLWGVIRTIFTYKPSAVTFSLDGGEKETRPLLIVAIGNGRFIGGGLEVTPDARPDDGLLDVIVIDNIPRWRLPPHLIRLLRGKVKEIPGASYRKCKEVTLAAPGMRVNIDGEIIPMDSASLSIVPSAIRAHW